MVYLCLCKIDECAFAILFYLLIDETTERLRVFLLGENHWDHCVVKVLPQDIRHIVILPQLADGKQNPFPHLLP